MSNEPEPVKLRTSPAAIGVPGMVLSANELFGRIRLNENEVGKVERTVARNPGAEGRSARNVVKVSYVVFFTVGFMLLVFAFRDV